jgi:predicted dehydrogenase
VRVALVGVGYWGEKVLRNLVALLGPRDVVAVDVRAERRRWVGDLYPGMRVEPSLEEALVDDEVVGSVIATPVESHVGLARQALEAGRHVLVEKPLGTSTAEAHAVAQLGADRHLKVMVGHTFLFSPRVEVLTSSVRQGRIGTVNYVTTSRLNLGLYRSDTNVIWDLAPHDFSIVFHVLDEYPALVQTMAQSSDRTNVPDVAFINLSFPSGAIASVTVSWRAPRKVRNTVVVGDRGMIVYDDTQPDEPVKLYDRGVVRPESASFGENQLTYRYGDTVSPHVSAQEPLLLELRHFLECIEHDEESRSDGWFGLEVVRALEAADRSWRLDGAPVTIASRPVKRPA